MSLVNTKSMLAKLLASENITVEHGNYQTGSMDVKNRVLRLPIWKEMMSSLYDLMVLHEVGHGSIHQKMGDMSLLLIKVLDTSHSLMLLRMLELRERSKTSITGS